LNFIPKNVKSKVPKHLVKQIVQVFHVLEVQDTPKNKKTNKKNLTQYFICITLVIVLVILSFWSAYVKLF
tara:strand:+ start:182 stop:391 length:210 start_codon:yes stop_codon:yes gene_type:complete